MLAVTAPAPFDSPEHWFEIKWDGLRCIAFVERDRIRLQSRNLRDLTLRYPALSAIPELFRGEERAVIDGELLGFAGGRPSFQAALRGGGASLLVGFDLLHLDGRDLLDQPLETRYRLLSEAFDWRDQLMLSKPVPQDGRRYYAAAAEQGLEGVMAKRLGSRYYPGTRSRDWVKFVVRRTMECTVLGLTAGAIPAALWGRPYQFGSLLVGVSADAGWLYLGNVGTGWNARSLAELLGRLRPASEAPWKPSGGAYGSAGAGGPPARIARFTAWVEPDTRIEVGYREITADGVLRHASFLRVMPDTGADGADQP